MWGNFLKEYFTFSRGERNGIVVLLFIIGFLIALPYLLEFFRQRKEIDFSQFQKEIDEFEKRQALAQAKKIPADTALFELFNFDPNEIKEVDWRRLGVGEKIAHRITNYRSKGGHFYEKEDLLKIYGFDSAQYEVLEPYIVFTESETPAPFDKPVYRKTEEKKYAKEKFAEQKKPEYKSKEIVIIEVNGADSTELVRIRGIGPTLSKRIIRYRDKLGGFVNVNQLLEVYGMDSTWFEVMKPSLEVDSSLVSKIALNTITQEELEQHPYFGRNIARMLVNYRQQHGSFQNADDLKKVYLIDENLLKKIKPYVLLE